MIDRIYDQRWLERKSNLMIKDVDGHVEARPIEGPHSEF